MGETIPYSPTHFPSFTLKCVFSHILMSWEHRLLREKRILFKELKIEPHTDPTHIWDHPPNILSLKRFSTRNTFILKSQIKGPGR